MGDKPLLTPVPLLSPPVALLDTPVKARGVRPPPFFPGMKSAVVSMELGISLVFAAALDDDDDNDDDEEEGGR